MFEDLSNQELLIKVKESLNLLDVCKRKFPNVIVDIEKQPTWKKSFSHVEAKEIPASSLEEFNTNTTKILKDLPLNKDKFDYMQKEWFYDIYGTNSIISTKDPDSQKLSYWGKKLMYIKMYFDANLSEHDPRFYCLKCYCDPHQNVIFVTDEEEKAFQEVFKKSYLCFDCALL